MLKSLHIQNFKSWKGTGPIRRRSNCPDHLGLKNFDNADGKFVAVAAAPPGKPDIVQAADSKWWGWKTALEESGINLNLPCKDELKAKWEAKFGRNV
jgi:hypothetical protein